MHKMQLDADTLVFLKSEIDKPLDVIEVARHADSPESAAEIYLASVMVIDIDDPRERAYLDSLAKELNLDATLTVDLEWQVKLV